MHSLVTVDNEEIKKAKGVNINVVKSTIHKKYVDFFFNKYFIRHKMKRIPSIFHRFGTYDICEISLFRFDDKIYILNDGINSLAYFHKDVKSQ